MINVTIKKYCFNIFWLFSGKFESLWISLKIVVYCLLRVMSSFYKLGCYSQYYSSKQLKKFNILLFTNQIW